jgi:hypothetical protein
VRRRKASISESIKTSRNSNPDYNAKLEGWSEECLRRRIPFPFPLTSATDSAGTTTSSARAYSKHHFFIEEKKGQEVLTWHFKTFPRTLGKNTLSCEVVDCLVTRALPHSQKETPLWKRLRRTGLDVVDNRRDVVQHHPISALECGKHARPVHLCSPQVQLSASKHEITTTPCWNTPLVLRYSIHFLLATQPSTDWR